MRPWHEDDINTLLAALGWYKHSGMGDTDNRPDWLQEIACPDGANNTSLDDKGIDQLADELEDLLNFSVLGEPLAFSPHWPEALEQNHQYKVLCDDKGRNGTCYLTVMVANDGDLHVGCYEQEEPTDTPSVVPSIRVRSFAGGGANRRTRQALLWLADAIRRDNEENKARGRRTVD